MVDASLRKGLSGFNVRFLPTFADFAAIVRSLAAGLRTQIAFVGDSTTAGWGSNGASLGGGVAGDATNCRRARSHPQLLAAEFADSGLPSRADAVIGAGTTSNNTTAEFTAHVPWVTFAGSGWALSAVTSAGGRLFENTATTDVLTFTPLVPANSFDIYYIQQSGFATFNVTDSGGTLTGGANVNASGATTVVKITVSRAVASLLPISIAKATTSGTMRLLGIVPFDTTDPCLEILNMGWAGSQSGNWISSGSVPAAFNAITALTPTQWVLELGPNDINAGVASATFGSNMALFVDRLMSIAPVSLGIPPASRNGVGNSYDITDDYVSELLAIKSARPNMTPTFDFRSMSWNRNDYFDSSVHMDASGYRKKARKCFEMFG